MSLSGCSWLNLSSSTLPHYLEFLLFSFQDIPLSPRSVLLGPALSIQTVKLLFPWQGQECPKSKSSLSQEASLCLFASVLWLPSVPLLVPCLLDPRLQVTGMVSNQVVAAQHNFWPNHVYIWLGQQRCQSNTKPCGTVPCSQVALLDKTNG